MKPTKKVKIENIKTKEVKEEIKEVVAPVKEEKSHVHRRKG